MPALKSYHAVFHTRLFATTARCVHSLSEPLPPIPRIRRHPLAGPLGPLEEPEWSVRDFAWRGERTEKVFRYAQQSSQELQQPLVLKMEHIDVIERMLGYKFLNYQNLLTLLPQNPTSTKSSLSPKGRTEQFDRLSMLGEFVLRLPMLEMGVISEVRREWMKPYTMAIGLGDFVHRALMVKPKGPNRNNPNSERFFVTGTGIFGAAYLDGGIRAVASIVDHTYAQFMEGLKQQTALPQIEYTWRIGKHAAKFLFVYSLSGQLENKKLLKYLHPRTSESWYSKVASKGDVRKFIQSYISTKYPETVVMDTSEWTVQVKGGDLKNDAKETLSPGKFYNFFLGLAYREGGLDLVRDMLNSHDPGAYNKDSCPTTLRKLMLQFDEQDATFWKS